VHHSRLSNELLSLSPSIWFTCGLHSVFRVEPDDYVSKANRNNYIAVVKRRGTEIKRARGFGSATAARKWLETQAAEHG